ncbi:MAG: hypothetical protein JSR82_06715 [Verrucomicrobia bacterium]|nr:hypothetical protein [Verrucomicrobiota bacterium]
MKLHELKRALRAHPERLVRIQLPDGDSIPAAYHLTEVGQVSKVFIDCGGKVHSELRCVLQTWVGRDTEHRLRAGRFADILDLGRAVVASEEMEVEIEHGQLQAAQYPLRRWRLDGAGQVVLELTHKATDCLAKARCGEDGCGDAEESSCCRSDEPESAEAAADARAAASCCA